MKDKALLAESAQLLGPNTESIENLKGTADINLNFEYRYTKKIAVFLDLNNLASINYERFQDYPTMGFNLLGGFRFSF